MGFFHYKHASKYIDTLPPEGLSHLPDRLWPFIWFFIRQIKGRFTALLLIGIVAGVCANLGPYFFGQMIGVFTETTDKAQIWNNLQQPLTLYIALVLIA
ncbi:MAG TPA: hypothetical protein VIN59_06150, partial [Alphaproteobacteria bacterium]